MQQKKLFNLFYLSSVVAVAMLFGSCKKTYEVPPVTGEPGIVANTTIKDLKARYTVQGNPIAITDDVVISGIVNADDRSGNYYQQISIQDETGGLILRLAGSNLYTSYPVGRKIYIKAKGLYMGDYGRMIQIGGGIDSSGSIKNVTLLAANLVDQHIMKGEVNQPLTPKTVTVSQLGTSLQDPYVNTLIRLENFEFSTGDLSKKYADATASGNRTVQGCTSPSSNKLTLRTSNYSNFATMPLPQGNGAIIGVYSIFNSTKQLTIRDTSDVQFYGVRCNGSTGPAGFTSFSLGSSSPFVFDFNDIASGLPAGVNISTTASATALGTSASFNSIKALWNGTGAGFKNYASATGLSSSATSSDQDNAGNRALGVRQTGTADIGGDPGAAFMFSINNTTGKNNLKLNFLLQSLDNTSTRTTTWSVDYGLGETPSSFVNVAASGTLTTGNSTFSNVPISVDLPAALSNQPGKVWIRIVAKSSTTGGGSRTSTAIDDVKFSWN